MIMICVKVRISLFRVNPSDFLTSELHLRVHMSQYWSDLLDLSPRVLTLHHDNWCQQLHYTWLLLISTYFFFKIFFWYSVTGTGITWTLLVSVTGTGLEVIELYQWHLNHVIGSENVMLVHSWFTVLVECWYLPCWYRFVTLLVTSSVFILTIQVLFTEYGRAEAII